MALASNLKPPRTYPSVNAVMGIRVHVQMANPNPIAGQIALQPNKPKHIGTIPAGSFVIPSAKHTIVAFNGTTPKVVVGSEADDDGFSGATGGLETAGFAGLVQGAQMGNIAAETPVYIKLTGTGVTAGEVDFVLMFYTNAD